MEEDGYCRCITCGKVLLPKEADCAHYLKRQHQATRFTEMNTGAQCGKCNRFEQGRDVIFRQKLVEKYGEDRIAMMEMEARKPYKQTQYRLDYIAALYKQKAEQLAREKGISLW